MEYNIEIQVKFTESMLFVLEKQFNIFERDSNQINSTFLFVSRCAGCGFWQANRSLIGFLDQFFYSIGSFDATSNDKVDIFITT